MRRNSIAVTSNSEKNVLNKKKNAHNETLTFGEYKNKQFTTNTLAGTSSAFQVFRQNTSPFSFIKKQVYFQISY